MAENYCGKSCEMCEQKEALGCTGCMSGPGARFGGDCELARCCREKGHEACSSCLHRGTCGTLMGSRWIPEKRIRDRKYALERADTMARRAPVLGKWLWILFWLFIPGAIAGLMTQNTVVELLPAIHLPGQLLNTATAAAYGLVLLRLSSESGQYKTAGILNLVTSGLNLVILFLGGGELDALFAVFLSIPALIVGLIATKMEYEAHSEMLTGVNQELADKWRFLWKLHYWALIALVAAILVLLIIPIVGVLGALAASVAAIAESILRLVYLYKTAKFFREN